MKTLLLFQSICVITNAYVLNKLTVYPVPILFVRVSNLGRGKKVSSENVQTASGTHPTSYSIGAGILRE
jgi:hypothetical protein